MDFLTVSTITFGVLYCLFVIGYDRRRFCPMVPEAAARDRLFGVPFPSILVTERLGGYTGALPSVWRQTRDTKRECLQVEPCQTI